MTDIDDSPYEDAPNTSEPIKKTERAKRHEHNEIVQAAGPPEGLGSARSRTVAQKDDERLSGAQIADQTKDPFDSTISPQELASPNAQPAPSEPSGPSQVVAAPVSVPHELQRDSVLQWMVRHLGYFDPEIRLGEGKGGVPKILQIPSNIQRLIQHEFAIKYDITQQETVIGVSFPYERLTEEHVLKIQRRVSDLMGTTVLKQHVHDQINAVGFESKVNPIAEMISSFPLVQPYDFSRTLIDFGTGIPDTPYVRLVTHRYLVSAVHRAYEPGCLIEGTLILTGEQGGRKSSFFRTLAVRPEFFSDQPLDIEAQWAHLNLAGKWFHEFAELAAIRKKDIEPVKSFLTRTEEDTPKKFENTKTRFLRTVVFGGTSNNPIILSDQTGNRRFWVVDTKGAFNLEALAYWMPTIWANVREFHLRHRQDQDFWRHIFFTPEDKPVLEAGQSGHLEADAYKEQVTAHIGALSINVQTVTLLSVQRSLPDIPVSWLNRNFRPVMQSLGWQYKEWHDGTKHVRGYQRAQPA